MASILSDRRRSCRSIYARPCGHVVSETASTPVKNVGMKKLGRPNKAAGAAEAADDSGKASKVPASCKSSRRKKKVTVTKDTDVEDGKPSLVAAAEKKIEFSVADDGLQNSETISQPVAASSADTPDCTRETAISGTSDSKPFSCQVCIETFNKESCLKEHQQSHSHLEPASNVVKKCKKRCLKNASRTCEVCKKEFKRVCELERHMVVHSGLKPFVCEVCGLAFTQAGNMKNHKRIHTGERPFKCDTCGKTFIRKGDLKSHKMTHSGIKPFVCDVCQKAFISADYLNSHKRIHSSNKPFVCEECGIAFHKASALKAHMKVHSGKKDFTCDECKKSFSTKGILKTHKMTHTGYKPYICSMCNKGFTRESSMKKHMMIHTGERPYVCEVCGKGYIIKSEWEIHMRTHTGERPFECNFCEASFARKANLLQHISAVHMGSRPHVCDVCNKAFTEVRSLKEHKYIHTGERPHKCKTCGKAFTQAGSLKIHMRCHSGEKPYKCNHCEKRFSDLGSRNRHHRTHTGETPYTCSECPAAFARSEQRKNHMRTVHHSQKPALEEVGATTVIIEQSSRETTSDMASAPTIIVQTMGDLDESTSSQVTESLSSLGEQFIFTPGTTVILQQASPGYSLPDQISSQSIIEYHIINDPGELTKAQESQDSGNDMPEMIECQLDQTGERIVDEEMIHSSGDADTRIIELKLEDGRDAHHVALMDSHSGDEDPSSPAADQSTILHHHNGTVSGVGLPSQPTENVDACSDQIVVDASYGSVTSLYTLATVQAAIADLANGDVVTRLEDATIDIATTVTLDKSSKDVSKTLPTDSVVRTSLDKTPSIADSLDTEQMVTRDITTSSQSTDLEDTAVLYSANTSSVETIIQNPAVCNKACVLELPNDEVTIKDATVSDKIVGEDSSVTENATIGETLVSDAIAVVDPSVLVEKVSADPVDSVDSDKFTVIYSSGLENAHIVELKVSSEGVTDVVPVSVKDEMSGKVSLANSLSNTEYITDVQVADQPDSKAYIKSVIDDLLDQPVEDPSIHDIDLNQATISNRVARVNHTRSKSLLVEVDGKAASLACSFKGYKRKFGVNPKQWICEICGNGFTMMCSLRKHIAVQHKKGKVYTCDICSKKCSSKSELESHRRCHTGERPFKCELCTNTYKHKAGLQQHIMAGHMGARPFPCRFCGKAFTEKRSLKDHVLIHAGVKPHKCGVCGKAFTQSSSLKNHQRTHSGMKPFVCRYCGKKFCDQSTFNRHQRIHTGEKPHKCQYCTSAFARSEQLKTHVKNVHPGDLQNLTTLAEAVATIT